jgi:hypothetical protein
MIWEPYRSMWNSRGFPEIYSGKNVLSHPWIILNGTAHRGSQEKDWHQISDINKTGVRAW